MSEKVAQKNKNYSFFSTAIILLVAVTVTIPFLIQSKTVMPIYEFKFNPFVLLTALGLIANLIVVVLLFRRQKKTFDSLWLVAASSAVFLFAMAEFFQRLSANPNAAVFWAQLGGIGVSFGSAFYFLFAVNYTNPENPNAFMTSAVIIGAAIISFFHANGSLYFKTDSASIIAHPWGFNNNTGPAFISNFLWFTTLTIIAVVLIFKYRHHTKNKIIRSQATIFGVGIATPLIGGIIFDSLLPVLGITALPPMGVTFFTVTGILMVIGIWKYRVFELSPTILSQNILTTMSEAVVVTNNDLGIEYVNAEAEKLFESDSTKLYSHQVSDVLSNSQRLNELRNNVINGDTMGTIEPIEDMTIENGQGKRYLRILASPISRNKQVEGFIFVISDITQLQHAYFDLQAAKTSVDQVVEERTHELRQAQSKLLETDKLKTEFIMLASHNLRTPLAVVEGYAELLSRSELDRTQKLAITKLSASTKRLSDLIGDMLTISTIESGNQPMDRKPIKASELFEHIFKEAGLLADTTSNTFSTELEVGDAQVLVSPDRLGAAIINIIDNAFKFTNNGQVTCTAKQQQDKIVITIKDNGVGINAEELAKLFTKFHRGSDTLNYQYEGEGLGLYLAKQIITEHDGTVHVESVENEGTTATIEIPILSSTFEQPASEA